MYTVILYWQEKAPGNGAFAPEYCDFLFSYTQIQDQTQRWAYTGPGSLRRTVRALERTLGERKEWRLILFDGRPSTPEEENGLLAPDTIRREWTSLLLYISGEMTEEGLCMEIAPPREVWYLGCSERGVYTPIGQNDFAYGKLLLTQEEIAVLCKCPPVRNTVESAGSSENGESEKLISYCALDAVSIPSFRMCWVEVQPGNGILHRQETFRLCCILLVLASGHNFSDFMHSGYLYKIRLKLDWSRLVTEMGRLRQQNSALGILVQRAWADYYQVRQETTSYLFPRNLYRTHIRPQSTVLGIQKLTTRDLRRGKESELERKLQSIRQWIRVQFISPDINDQLTQPISLEDQNRDVPLNASGLESVRTEMDRSVRRLCQIRQAEHDPLHMEQDLVALERQVFDRMEDRATAPERRLVMQLFAVLEGLTFSVFCIDPLDSLAGFLLRCCVPSFSVNPFLKTNIWKLLLFLLAIIGISRLSLAVTHLYSRFLDWYVVEIQYNGYLRKTLKGQGKRKKQDANLLKEILLYRYHCALLQRQHELNEIGDRQRESLRHHKAFQESVTRCCEQVELILGEEVPSENETTHLPMIVFSKEPEAADYFWRPTWVSSMKDGLNHSGTQTETMFDFITEVTVYRTATLRALKNPPQLT